MSRAGKTVGRRALKAEMLAHRGEDPLDHPRPKTRAECPPHPCPYVGCRHHLYLDVSGAGSIIYNFAGEPEEMQVSCALDIADKEREGVTLETIAGLLGVARERIRQIEKQALAKANEAGLEPSSVVDLAPGPRRAGGTS